MIYCIHCGGEVAETYDGEWYHVGTGMMLCLATVAEPANLP